LRFEARAPIGMLPMAFIAGAGNVLFEGAVGFVVRMRRKLMPVQHDLSFRKCRNEAARRRPIAANRGTSAAQHFMNIKSISINKSLCQEFSGHTETDIPQIGWRRESRIAKFVNIKCKFRSNVP